MASTSYNRISLERGAKVRQRSELQSTIGYVNCKFLSMPTRIVKKAMD